MLNHKSRCRFVRRGSHLSVRRRFPISPCVPPYTRTHARTHARIYIFYFPEAFSKWLSEALLPPIYLRRRLIIYPSLRTSPRGYFYALSSEPDVFPPTRSRFSAQRWPEVALSANVPPTVSKRNPRPLRFTRSLPVSFSVSLAQN